MLTLLVHMHSYQTGYPTMPIVGRARLVLREAGNILTQVKAAIERSEL